MSGLIDWIFPENVACFLCGAEAFTDGRGLCKACAARLQSAEEQPCPAGLDGFFAGALLDEAAERAIHRMKYDDARYLAPFFANLIELPPHWRAEVVVPVPLHKKKLRRRGYNQSALIARALAQRLGLPVAENLLSRVRDTDSQTRLHAAERAQNVADAFAASKEAVGRRILLVDDVCTTGATLCACAAALRRAGAKEVYAATALARALQI